MNKFGYSQGNWVFGMGSSLEMNMTLAFLSINLLINQVEAHRST